jgi:hypothetical protein
MYGTTISMGRFGMKRVVEQPAFYRSESRLFPALTIAVVVVILVLVPGRYRAMPPGFEIASGAILVGAIIAAGLAPTVSVWHRLERYAIGIFAAFVTCLEIAILSRLLYDMASRRPNLSAIALLSTAVAIWLINIVIFALVYWQLDRNGPLGRATAAYGRCDFSFPRGDPSDGVPANWQPIFVDYLFLAFTAATAFSPTDTIPLTPRAKMLMMLESMVSLVTIAAVAARAINILGG